MSNEESAPEATSHVDNWLQVIARHTLHTLSIILRKQSSASPEHSHVGIYGNTDNTVKHTIHSRKLKLVLTFWWFL